MTLSDLCLYLIGLLMLVMLPGFAIVHYVDQKAH